MCIQQVWPEPEGQNLPFIISYAANEYGGWIKIVKIQTVS